ncbi:MAG: hypothetical protein QXK65_00350 [Candidatus Micrarchaeaceae archaeon]
MDSLLGIVMSIAVVALTIYAIALFITSGAGAYFYEIVVIDLIISFVNAWFISSGRYERAEKQNQTVPKSLSAITAQSGAAASAAAKAGRGRKRKKKG